jgi:hypothetical protein
MTASNCEYNRCRLTVAAQVSKPTSSAASRPAELGESAIRQVWKSRLLRPACEGRDLATLRRPERFPGRRSAQFLAASRTAKITA